MTTKRFLGLLLSVIMAFSCVSFAAAEDVADVKLTGTVNKYGWEVPEETLKFTYYA